MIRGRLLPVFLLLLTQVSLGQPTDENQKAASYVGRLMAWKEGPKVLIKECAKIDPGGVKERQQIYSSWMEKNRSSLETVDRHAQLVLPKLFPSISKRGGDPVEFFKAKTTVDLTMYVASQKPERLKALCDDFAGFRNFNSDFSPSLTKEAFDFLTQWEENPSGDREVARP